ncbi:MAG: sugar transferase [Clostridia bacterium]|nr:sugar transferase [Clostridia bacterium]
MYLKIKRALDFTLSLVALVALSPVMGILALIVKLTSPGPVLFTQKRVGIHKRYFTIYKFRTMRTDAPKDKATHLLKNAKSYITPVGRFLRKSSLDELPQLVNIIRGDMAIVGPRPALYNQYDLIAERDKYGANDVLPGLTGLAQVDGRDELPIKEKAKRDGYYCQNISFALDVKLIARTFLSVIRFKGVVEGAREDKR